MKKIISILLLIVMTAAASFAKTATRNITVGDFSKIKVSSIVNVIFIQGKATGEVQVTAPETSLPYVKVSVDNKTLRLGFSPKNNENKSHGPITITVQAPSLNSIKTSGASNFKVKGELNLKNNLSLGLEGASGITIPDLEGEIIIVEQTGASTLKLPDVKGKAMNATVNGSSSMTIGDAIVPVMTLNISGASNVKIGNQKGKQLDIDVQGVANVNVSDTQASYLNLSAMGVGKLKVGGIDAQVTSIVAAGEGMVYVWGKSDKWEQNVSGLAKIKRNVGSQSEMNTSKSTSKSSSKKEAKKRYKINWPSTSEKEAPTQAP